MCRADKSVSRGFLLYLWDDIRPHKELPSETINYLEDYVRESHNTSSSFGTGFQYSGRDYRTTDQSSILNRWLNVLKTEGYDFEEKDKYGSTPLLQNLSTAGGRGFAMVRLLHNFGVNVHAVDNFGLNAIQVAMLSKHNNGEYPDILEEKLRFLIKANVDIHHRDNFGTTPSYDALFNYSCWTEWVRALKSCGLSISRVLQDVRESYQWPNDMCEECLCTWDIREESEEEESNEEESDEGEDWQEEKDGEESNQGE